MHFTKMQGIGNDYLYFYDEVPDNVGPLARALSDRHFGIGSDGLIFITQSDKADFGMRIFNADGSEALMCGNGIRCVGKYVYENGYTDKDTITVDTLSGIKTLYLDIVKGTVEAVTVAMGKAEYKGTLKMEIAGKELEILCVDTGNPHAVIFTDDLSDRNVTGVGRLLEHHPVFPDGVNTEFIHVIDERTLRMRVWERGSGVTMACGTGACASTAAAVKSGICPPGSPVTVKLDGGDLNITVFDDGSVVMRGPAAFVFEGEAVYDTE